MVTYPNTCPTSSSVHQLLLNVLQRYMWVNILLSLFLLFSSPSSISFHKAAWFNQKYTNLMFWVVQPVQRSISTQSPPPEMLPSFSVVRKRSVNIYLLPEITWKEKFSTCFCSWVGSCPPWLLVSPPRSLTHFLVCDSSIPASSDEAFWDPSRCLVEIFPDFWICGWSMV